MLQNYFKTALRGLSRNKLYVLINVFGLGIALACCIIAYLNWKYDHDFNAMHSQGEKLFRVEVYQDGHLYGNAPLPTADLAVQDIPNVESAVRLDWTGLVAKYERNVHNDRITYVSDNFLDFFDFPLVKGDAASLKDKSKLMMTESAAKKFFGEEDPIGKTIHLNPNKPEERFLTVGGILEDPPLNSSIRFSLLTNFDNRLDQTGKPINNLDWSRFVDVTFLALKNPSQSEQVTAALNQYVPVQNEGQKDWKIDQYYLEPLKNVASNRGQVRANYLWNAFPEAAVWGPIVMALCLLITSCLNFTNTTISLSGNRLKEMGVRKVMGSTRRQLVWQIFGETFVICLLALIAGIAFVDLLLPPYNEMWEYLHLEANYFDNPPLLLFMAISVLVAAILGGAYPALYISAFNPANIFRGSVKFGGSNLFSRILLGVQIMIALSSVITGIAFAQNSEFQRTTDIGYEHHDILAIPTFEEGAFETFRKTVEENPKVLASAGTRHHIDWWDARFNVQIQQQDFETLYFGIGEDYLDVMDMEILKGRNFDSNRKLDYENALIINETFANTHQWEDPIGKKITLDSVEHSVIGLFKDIYNEGFFDPLVPIIMKLERPEKYTFWVVEAKPEDLIAINNQFKSQWNALFPFKPYESFFQSELMQGELTVSNNIATITLFLAIITILLSAVGLFALVSLNVLKRLKEIAIRKIVGAPISSIAWLINKNYIWIFLGAAISGSIGGTILAKSLLSSIYATHVDVGIGLLIFSSIMIFIIAGFTIGTKIYGVTKTNPSDILRAD